MIRSAHIGIWKKGAGGGRSMDDGKKKQKIDDKKRVRSVKYGINI